MKPFVVTPITKELVVQFNDREVQLPAALREKIDVYWDDLIAAGKSYQRGEVFTVTKKEFTEHAINILVERTDYAHYLYCQNVDDSADNGVRIIHTASLVETSDGYTVFGEMGHQTARAGMHQLCGGGIDNDDIRDGYFDFAHNISKELQEELDIDVTDRARVASCERAFFKEGGPTDKMTVIYRVILNETKDQFLQKYSVFVKGLGLKNELPEFEKLITLKCDGDEISDFCANEERLFDEYMKPLFTHLGEI